MKLPAIVFEKEKFASFSELLKKEWLITNGLGSYASSTVPLINTRKYHGLFVVALNPPGNRTVCLSKLDEDILVDDSVYRLGSNEFHDVIYPSGYDLISQFSVDPFPRYLYNLDKVQVSKTIFMSKQKNAVAIIYKLTNKSDLDVTVRLYPLLTCRYFHTVIYKSEIPLNFTLKNDRTQFQATFHKPQARIICRITDGDFREKINWLNHLYYREEASRGEADSDDCFQPGYFELEVSANMDKEFAITCAVGPETQKIETLLDSIGVSVRDIKETFYQEINHKSAFISGFYLSQSYIPMSDWLNWVLLAADSFLVNSHAGKKAVISGYHWFEPWGRDTFISLPGLMLVTGKYNIAKAVLQNFNEYYKSGLIPNFVSDKSGFPVYNTVDGTLWYVNAVLQYIKYTCDFDFVKDILWEKLQGIVESHQKGTLFGIRMDQDCLLMHGPRLTWMDASTGNDAVTPRSGKAVEIQALWYNTLLTMELLAKKFGEASLAEKYVSIAKQTRQSFNEKFWNPQNDCLFDVVNEKVLDASIRPNQIFAVSLDYTMLDKEKSKKVVDVVKRELVTPYGLRTLAVTDPKFIGKCSGDRRSRDKAYHNGTIWPWLLGSYITAFVKINDYSTTAREQILENLVLPLFKVGINQGGLGTISEIYDSDPPNEPRGCISQAWSVAEPLRAYLEDILQVGPNKVKDLHI